jgi:hypothetical protein
MNIKYSHSPFYCLASKHQKTEQMITQKNCYYLFIFLLLLGCKQKKVQTKVDAINYYNLIKEKNLDLFKCYRIFPRDYDRKDTFFFIEKDKQCNISNEDEIYRAYRGAFLFKKGILDYHSYNLELSDEVKNVIMEFKALQKLGCYIILSHKKGIQIRFDSNVFLYKRFSDFAPEGHLFLVDDWYFRLSVE